MGGIQAAGEGSSLPEPREPMRSLRKLKLIRSWGDMMVDASV